MRKSIPIFYNALLLTAVNLLLRFVSTSFQVHISNRIGPEGVGLLQLVMSIAAMSTTAGMAGIRTATMYLTAEELGKNQTQNMTWVLRGCLIYSLLFSGSVSLLVHILVPYLAETWIGNPATKNALHIFAAFLPVVCMTGCMTGYFTAENKIGTLAVIEVGEQLCYMAVTIIALTLWAGTNAERACQAIVFGSGISSTLTLISLFIFRIKEKNGCGKPIPISKRLMHTALPLALADNLKSGINTAENLMVPKRLSLYSSAVSPLAMFGTVVGMVFPVMMFPAAILYALAELLIPELARCNAGNKQLRIRYLIRRGLQVALLYGCISGSILYLIADDLCIRLYHNHTAGNFLRMYSLLIPMLYCDIITDAMTKGLGQQTACVRYNIITSAMDVFLLFFLLPEYGMNGYFFSFFISHAFNFILSLNRLLKVSKIKLQILPILITCLAMIASTGLAALFHSMTLRVLAFLLLYASMLVLTGVLSVKDLNWIKGLIARK